MSDLLRSLEYRVLFDYDTQQWIVERTVATAIYTSANRAECVLLLEEFAKGPPPQAST